MPNGIIIIDKPQEWTSMDVCGKLRRLFKEKRVGHAGTLDPMATGVLTVFVGRATRAVEFAETGGKQYRAVLRLGIDTDTQDTTGTTLAESSLRPTREQIEAVLPQFRGNIEQIPPMYSALKRNGKKLYELARQGKTVEREARPVTIFALSLGEQLSESDWELTVKCSKGTYIRTLCHDIGAVLGCGGAMAALRRTEAAGFTLSDCVTLEQVAQAVEAGTAEQLLHPVEELFQAHPRIDVAGTQERLCRNGNTFHSRGEDGFYRVYSSDGAFLMLGERRSGEMYTVKSFF